MSGPRARVPRSAPARCQAFRRLVPLLGLALLFPATAGAAELRVDFESGPPVGTPVEDQYLATAGVRFPKDPGFRPRRRIVAASAAHSGTVVADVGGAFCLEDGGSGADCEFVQGGTTGRLTRTASTVTLFAGRFDPLGLPETVHLSAHRTNGSTVTGPSVVLPPSGFGTALTVSSPAADIDAFTLTASGGDVGFDDLRLTVPGTAADPDVALSLPSPTTVLTPGRTTTVPIRIDRLNGSSGPVRLAITGLPPGVVATAVPNPVTGTGGQSELRLAVAPDVPDSAFKLTKATLSADPGGDPAIAPARRTATFDVRVASAFSLGTPSGTPATAALPDCAPVDVPITVARDLSFAAGTDSVTLSVENLPPGTSATVLPDDTVAPGGGTTAERTIRLSRTSEGLPGTATVRASTPGLADRTLPLELTRATSSGQLDRSQALTPRGLGPGGEVRVTGTGFCPGTRVRVGNSDPAAEVDADVIDPHTLAFRVPRLASSGLVVVIPPARPQNFAFGVGQLEVSSVRDTDGFAFANYAFGHLSLSELTEAFGDDDLFVKVNPCFPFGDCTIRTGFLNPVAALNWGILNVSLRDANGHCFGIARGVQQLTSGRVRYRRFTAKGTSVFSIPGPDGPGPGVTDFLDAQQALQGSKEYLTAWLRRERSLTRQLDRIRAGLKNGELPIVALRSGDRGHAVNAYDVRETPDGADIDVYDSNQPFTAEEDSSIATHSERLDKSVIHLDTTHGTWDYRDLHGAGDDLFATTTHTIPDDPSLPGVGTLGRGLEYLVFGSADGAVETTGASPRADYLPALDDHAAPRSGGWWLTRDRRRPLSMTLRGRHAGRYAQAYVAGGLVAAVTDVQTALGVEDRLTGAGDGVRFASGTARPLKVALARPLAGGAVASATVSTHASRGGQDAVALAVHGDLRYVHHGAATTASFTLGGVRADGGPASVTSGPLQVGDGDRLTATPVGRGGGAVRLTVRRRDGRHTERMLRARVHAPARLLLSAPRRSGRRISARVRVSGLRSSALLGAGLRVLRGHRVVARTARSSPARNGASTLAVSVPRGMRGRLRVLADARVMATGARGHAGAGAAFVHRAAAVDVRRRTRSPGAR